MFCYLFNSCAANLASQSTSSTVIGYNKKVSTNFGSGTTGGDYSIKTLETWLKENVKGFGMYI